MCFSSEDLTETSSRPQVSSLGGASNPPDGYSDFLHSLGTKPDGESFGRVLMCNLTLARMPRYTREKETLDHACQYQFPGREPLLHRP